MAGGFTELADKRKIFVIRKENGRDKRLIVDYKKAMKGDDPGSNLVLKPGDTIVVEASGWKKTPFSPDSIQVPQRK
jgi:polysaccharide export outer membrane protein